VLPWRNQKRLQKRPIKEEAVDNDDESLDLTILCKEINGDPIIPTPKTLAKKPIRF
jgi:hypothetical protein